jgi:hypothetical protein
VNKGGKRLVSLGRAGFTATGSSESKFFLPLKENGHFLIILTGNFQ